MLADRRGLLRHLFLLSLLVAPPALAGSTYRQGMKLVKAGDHLAATELWFSALGADEADRDAIKGLDRWSDLAVRGLLVDAEEHEAQGRYAEALGAYDRVLELDARLQTVPGLVLPDRSAIRVDREEAETAWARAELSAGAEALAASRAEEAVAHYERATMLRPAWTEAKKPMGDAYFLWAQAALDAHQYPVAAERFDKAASLGAGRAARLWSAAVHTAMGDAWFKQTACRQAARSYRVAVERDPNGPAVDQLALAEDCARVELVVAPFEAVGGQEVTGTNAGAMVADALEAALRARGSEFLVLLDPTSTVAAQVGAGGLDSVRPGRLYQVRGRVTQLVVERPEPSVQARTGAATTQVVCPLPEGVYYRSDTWCDEPATLAWEEVSMSVTGRAAGSVRVVVPRTSEQVLTAPVEAVVHHASKHARSFTLAGSAAPVVVGEKPAEGVYAPGAEVLASTGPPAALPADSALTAEVVAQLAAKAAEAVLAQVDAEQVKALPARITVHAPVLDATQIELGGGRGAGAMEVEAPPVPEEPTPVEPAPTEAMVAPQP